MTRTRSLLAVALGAVALLVGAVPAPALAHTALTGSDPAADSSVATLPEAIVLDFGGPVQEPAFVVVTGPDGTDLHEGDPVVDGMSVRQPLATPDGADGADGAEGTGTHTVTYRVVAADGHPIQGGFEFEVTGDQTGDDPDGTDEVGPAPQPTADSTVEVLPTAPDTATPPTEDDGRSYLPITLGLLAVLAALLLGRVIVRRRRR